jgi:hypothetical protein
MATNGGLGSSLPHAGRFASSMKRPPHLYTLTIPCPAVLHRPSHWRMLCSRDPKRRRNFHPFRRLKVESRLHRRFHCMLMLHHMIPQRALWRHQREQRRNSERGKGRRTMIYIAVAASIVDRGPQYYRFHHGYRSARTPWRTCRRGRLPFSPLSPLSCTTARAHPPRPQPRALPRHCRPTPEAASTEPSRA